MITDVDAISYTGHPKFEFHVVKITEMLKGERFAVCALNPEPME